MLYMYRDTAGYILTYYANTYKLQTFIQYTRRILAYKNLFIL